MLKNTQLPILNCHCSLCRQIEDTILLALLSPETYDDIARGTRRKFESNRPRAVLFEGPPGALNFIDSIYLR